MTEHKQTMSGDSSLGDVVEGDSAVVGSGAASTPSDSAASQWLQKGVDRRKQGDYEGALACYREAAKFDEAKAVANFNIGNVLLERAEWSEAKKHFAISLSTQPGFPAAWLQMARCEVRLGNVAAAREAFAKVLQLEPKNFSAWLEAGNLCRQMGLMEQALASYRQCVHSAPDRWEGMLTLARTLEESGQWDEAAVHYHHALFAAGKQSGSARNVHHHMARYRLDRGDAARALESLRQALGLLRVEKPEPDVNERAELQIDLGKVLMRLGMADLAHRAFERASVATDENVLARLAQVSFQNNLWQEAQDVLKRNVALHPKSATALWNLAHSYAESWQMEEAERTLQLAEALSPQSGAKSMRASIAGRLGDVDTARQIYRELGEQEGPDSPMRSSAAMSSLYSDAMSAQEVSAFHRELFASMGEGAKPVSAFKKSKDSKRRIRLGFLSADMHFQHPVNIFMQPILKRLDRKKFEVFFYHTGIVHDSQTQLASQSVEHWVTCGSLSNVQLAKRIESDGIDVLVELSGHTSLNRMAMLAKRVAPVQVSFLGYPCSTGVPNIDWMLADPLVAPEGSESLFSEKIYRLPNTVFCYAPTQEYPFPAYGAEHLSRPLTFGSFNNVPKLTPHTIKLWSAVLAEVPGSRLVLKAPSFKDESAIRTFRDRFEKEGVDSARIEFRGPVGLTEMMAEYADVDIALDPVPYNGGTTTLQAMWMGVPVIVKKGNNFVSRMGASFMTAAGLGDWVAENDAQYVKIAAEKASDRDGLLKIKQNMRERLLNSPAWDIDQYTKHFEEAVMLMWKSSLKA